VNGTELLARSRKGALVAIAAFIIAADLVAFAGSYLGLYEWAARHGLAGWRAYAFPLMVDTFVAVGELALFVSLASGWPRRTRIGAAVITGVGLAASVAGNVGHAWTADWWTRATWAIPPLAASAALAIGLTVLKWTAAEHRARVTPRVTAWRPDPITKITADEHCAPKTAQLVQRRERAAVKAAFNGGSHE
jgi:hypothetical protein